MTIIPQKTQVWCQNYKITVVNLKQHARVLVGEPNRRKFDILHTLEGNNNKM